MSEITATHNSGITKTWAKEFEDDAGTKNLIRDMESKIPDLSTKNGELMDLMHEALVGEHASDATMMMFQALMQERMQKISAMTNFLKTMHETMMSIVRNLRLN